jgi:hypothetical protein
MKKDTTQVDATWLEKTGGYAKDITLRDHFAGLAMQAYLMDDAIFKDSDISARWLQKVAGASYDQADAMLKERSK